MAGSPSLSAVPAPRMQQRPTRRLFLGRRRGGGKEATCLYYSSTSGVQQRVRSRIFARGYGQAEDLSEIDSGREVKRRPLRTVVAGGRPAKLGFVRRRFQARRC